MSLSAFVLGLLNGLTIGLLAAGLVLVFKSSRFLNLAHAQIGALPALIVAKLVLDAGWNFWVAAVAAVALGAGSGFLVDRVLVTPLRRRTKSPLRLLLLSIGVSQVLLALTFIPALNPDTSKNAIYPQPFGTGFEIGGVRLTGMNVLTAIVVPALVLALAGFLQYSVYGRQIRAAANNPDAARLCGISVTQVSAITWAVSGAFAAVSAVLQGPNQASFNAPSLGPYLLMLTLGAAAFGAFTSLPAALAGGLVLGVVGQVVSAETSSAALSQLWVFGVILATVAVRGRAIARVFELSGAAVEEVPITRVPESLRDKAIVRYHLVWMCVATLAVLVAWPRLPWFDTRADQFSLAVILIYALLGVSLTMLLGWAGQVSLGNFALVGLGAFLAARSADDWTLLSLLLAVGGLGAAVMVVVGLPALRIRGLTLAVTTLGFAVIAHDWLFQQTWVTMRPFSTVVDGFDLGAGLGSVDSQIGAYYVALLVLAAAVLTATALRRSGPGRIFLAVRDNEKASAAFGVNPATVKLTLLAVSGFYSAVAGVLWALSWKSVSVTQFAPETSMAVLAIPVIGGLGSISGAVAAALLLYSTTFFLGPLLSGLFGELGQNLGFNLFVAGAGVVATVMQFPLGIAGEAQKRWQRYLDRQADRLAAESAGVDASLPLRVKGVRVRFGGRVALDSPDIEVRAGEVVGLIGTNGAGKTTLMNVISGLITPEAGSVRVYGKEVVDLAPDMRAGFGLARSFQEAALFGGLTVRETLQVAQAQHHKIGVVAAMVGAPWATPTERHTRAVADAIIERFGLVPWADARIADLSTGTRRICDLAAQVAAGPRLILLDEPTAGVAQREAEAFGPLLRAIRDELDCSVLIVEHDMPLLMSVCDRVYALESGAVIAEGTPQQVRDDERVVASYLGTEQIAIGRSGALARKGRR